MSSADATTDTTTTAASLPPSGKFLPPVSRVTNSREPAARPFTRTEQDLTSTSVITAAPATTTTSSASSTTSSPPPTSTDTAVATRQSGGVPTGAFYGFAGGIVVLILLVGGFLYFRWWRARATKTALEMAAHERAGRQQQDRDGFDGIFPPGQPAAIPLSSARSWTSSQWDARTNKTPRRPLEPSAQRPTAERSALAKDTMAHADAVNEGIIREQAQRRAHFAALTEASDVAREAAQSGLAGEAYESTARSDDSEMDVERRGPAVNPAYAALRDLRYREKLAAGMSIEQALSVSDASTDAGRGEGALVGARADAAAIVTLPAVSREQYGPRRVPERWAGTSAGAQPGVDEPGPVRRPRGAADSDELSDLGLTRTESETATRPSVALTDDPWREEAHENQRRGRLEAKREKEERQRLRLERLLQGKDK